MTLLRISESQMNAVEDAGIGAATVSLIAHEALMARSDVLRHMGTVYLS